MLLCLTGWWHWWRQRQLFSAALVPEGAPLASTQRHRLCSGKLADRCELLLQMLALSPCLDPASTLL